MYPNAAIFVVAKSNPKL